MLAPPERSFGGTPNDGAKWGFPPHTRGYFSRGGKVTKSPLRGSAPKNPARGRLEAACLGEGLSDTLPGEELRCPVNKSFLRGSDLVAWRLTNSACRPLKGIDPAKGIAPNRCAGNLHRTDVLQQAVR